MYYELVALVDHYDEDAVYRMVLGTFRSPDQAAEYRRTLPWHNYPTTMASWIREVSEISQSPEMVEITDFEQIEDDSWEDRAIGYVDMSLNPLRVVGRIGEQYSPEERYVGKEHFNREDVIAEWSKLSPEDPDAFYTYMHCIVGDTIDGVRNKMWEIAR